MATEDDIFVQLEADRIDSDLVCGRSLGIELGKRLWRAALRAYLHRYHIRCTIARRSNESHRGSFNKQHYRKRHIVERLINRLKQFRRIAARDEKRAVNFAAMITIASIFLFSDFAHRL